MASGCCCAGRIGMRTMRAYASAMPDELIREEMKLIKAMGANFIRLGHYQQNRLVLELCDELGMLVWEEVPWCRGGIGGRALEDDGARKTDQHDRAASQSSQRDSVGAGQ